MNLGQTELPESEEILASDDDDFEPPEKPDRSSTSGEPITPDDGTQEGSRRK